MKRRDRTTPASMVAVLAITLGAASAEAAEAADKVQTRCGWFDNPTPGNAWLHDRDGEWIVGIQGGHQAEGDWPEFNRSQWVRTNGSHGYGCACLKVAVNPETHEIVAIHAASARPLSACRKDPALKKPPG